MKWNEWTVFFFFKYSLHTDVRHHTIASDSNTKPEYIHTYSHMEWFEWERRPYDKDRNKLNDRDRMEIHVTSLYRIDAKQNRRVLFKFAIVVENLGTIIGDLNLPRAHFPYGQRKHLPRSKSSNIFRENRMEKKEIWFGGIIVQKAKKNDSRNHNKGSAR